MPIRRDEAWESNPNHTNPLDGLTVGEDWISDAACGQVDNEIFYPDKGGSTREAKSICRSCLVVAECLDYALRNAEPWGIWGGLSPRERRQLTTLLDPEKPRSKASAASTERSTRTWQTEREFCKRHQVTPDEIRIWAATHGIDCNTVGPIRATVLSAWETDHRNDTEEIAS